MKFALKLPQINRHWLMLGGAIALGIVATTLSHKVLKDHMAALDAQANDAHQMVNVVVPKRDLPKGTLIVNDRAVWAVRPVPAEYASANSVDPRHFGQFTGGKLLAPLRAGEPLLSVYVEASSGMFSSTLENGHRALTTEVDEVNSISGMLKPSDHIDLMVTAHGSGTSAQTETTFALLSNVAVLATGQVTHKGDSGGQSRTYTTITLSVTPEDAERIVVAKNSGHMTAVLRNPEDTQPNGIHAMSIDDVIPKKPQAKTAPGVGPVQYIVGGKS